jgi:co-chaperonin GroES (HSP10)
MENFIALDRKILVQPIDDVQSVNGIILSVKKQTKHVMGKCISVGSECLNVTLGDTIVFAPIGAKKYKEMLVIDYDNVLGILSE